MCGMGWTERAGCGAIVRGASFVDGAQERVAVRGVIAEIALVGLHSGGLKAVHGNVFLDFEVE